MRKFLVGGAVRDILRGQTPRDHDYVVLNSSPEEMLRLGFIQVGASYQIFLHPLTKEEYVLAKDLRSDLERRDLTINSMAMDESKTIIDPFNGRMDLQNKILRHTSDHFCDDPLRIYRVARFKSQHPDFSIAPETFSLIKILAMSVEFKNLNGQRIFVELEKALSTPTPSSFFEILNETDALKVHFAEVHRWSHLDHMAAQDAYLRFAALVQDRSAEEIISLCTRLMIPNEWGNAALTASRIYPHLDKISRLPAEEVVEFFYTIDVFRKPEQLYILEKLYGERVQHLRKYYEILNSISVKDIAAGFNGKSIGDEIKKVRVKQLKDFIQHK